MRSEDMDRWHGKRFLKSRLNPNFQLISRFLSLSLFNETDSLHIPLATLFPSKGSPHNTQSQSQNASHEPNQTKPNFSSHFTLTLSFLIFFPNPRVLQVNSAARSLALRLSPAFYLYLFFLLRVSAGFIMKGGKSKAAPKKTDTKWVHR